MKTLDRRLLRIISGSRLQVLAIIVVIALGILSFTLLVNTYRNMDFSLYEYYRQQSFADLFVEVMPLPTTQLGDLENLPGIAAAEPRIVTDVRLDVGRETNPVLRLISVTEGVRVNIPLLREGRLPRSGERGVALLSRFADANGLGVGDRVDLVVRGEPFTVVVTGVADSPEYIYAIRDVRNFIPDDQGFGIGFLDLSLMQDLLGLPGQATEVVLLLRDGVCPDDAEDTVEEAMEGYGVKSMIKREDQLSHAMVSMELESLEQFSLVIPVAFLAIAAAIIYMMLSRLVKADRTAIGVLKAMGYSDSQVMAHYLKYALVMGIAGAALGMLGGHLLVGPTSELYMEFFNLPLLQSQTRPVFALLGIILTALFCGATGLWAARGVTSITPADAMRPPAPVPGQRNTLEVLFPGAWGRLSFGWKFVMRHLFRNKQRFLMAVMGVALSYTVVLMPFYMLDTVDLMFEQFGTLERYDYAVSFAEPVGARAVAEVREMVRAEAVEPFSEYPFRLALGWREETILARALPQGTELYRFEDEKGRLLSMPARGIFVSRYLAESLGIRAGDEVVVSSYMTGNEEHRVPVRAVVTQYLGSGIYMSLEQMDALTGQGGTYTGLLLQSNDDVRARLGGAGNVSSIYSATDMIEGFEEFMGLMIASVMALILIGGVLGFAILFNTASVSLAERTREFSSMRVMGYRRHEVYRVVLRENVIALLIGLAVGPPLGHGLFTIMARFISSDIFYMPAVVVPGSHLLAGVLVTAFTGLVLLAVWLRMKHLNLLEALSSRLT